MCDSCSYWLDICWLGTFKLDLVLLFCPIIFSFCPGNDLEIFCEISVDTLLHFNGKLIMQDLKTLWTNIWSHVKDIEILVYYILNLALLIFHQNEASGYFNHNQIFHWFISHCHQNRNIPFICFPCLDLYILSSFISISLWALDGTFSHGDFGTKSHHIKTYNRLTISLAVCVHSHQLLTNDTFQEWIKTTFNKK